MIVPALTRSIATALARRRLSGEPAPTAEALHDMAHEVGSLPRGDGVERVKRLTASLDSLAAEFSSGGRIVEVARFDAEASVLTHTTLGDLPTRVAAEHEFWLYLASGPLFDVVLRRYPLKGSAKPNLKNFGVGSIWDCLPRRLWFRGHVAYDDDATDPYHLARRGHVDFWISGLVRVLYGSIRPLARALVRFQYPQPGRFEGNEYRPATLDVQDERGIRILYKRLQHFTATTALATLDDAESLALIEDLARDLPRA